jgi:hypothetical protein
MLSDKQVTIEIAGRFAKVNRQVEELLAPRLTCRLHRFAPGGSHGHRRLQEEQKFYRIDGEDLIFPAAVVPEAVATLQRAGYRVTVRHLPYISRLPISESILAGLPAQEPQLLSAITQNFGGLIEVKLQQNVALFIAIIAQLFSTARILIAVATRAQVRQLQRRLRQWLGNDVKTPESWTFGSSDRLHVCTLNLFDLCIPGDWDIVILPDAVHAATKTHTGLVNLRRRPVFGFLVATDKLSQHTRLWLQSTCGPVIYSMPDGKGYHSRRPGGLGRPGSAPVPSPTARRTR